MKIKKSNLIFLALTLVLSLSIVGCNTDPKDTGMNNRDRLSTQTRIDNRWDNRTDDNWNRNNDMNEDMGMRDDLNNGLNDRMDTDLNGMNDNGMLDARNRNLNNGMTRPGNMNNMNTMASNLSEDITNLPEVSKASVVVNDDTALVGVSLRGKTQNTMTTTLRRKIEKMVRDTNNSIRNISVTTDPDLYTRINNMSTSILNGNPIEDFTDEIGDLFRRMGRGINNMAR